MKPNICHIFQKIITFINLFVITAHSNSTLNQHNQIIKIYSTSQITNMLNNTITFQDQVKFIHHNINIYADKILVHYIPNKCNFSTITAYGNPVVLCQKQKKSNNKISAQSLKMCYNTDDHIITLIGDAYIKKSENSIHSDYITYMIKEKKIKAHSSPGNQVITILKKN